MACGEGKWGVGAMEGIPWFREMAPEKKGSLQREQDFSRL